jgi:hypothetical protein
MRSLFTALAFVVCVTTFVSSQSSVAGDWSLSFNTPGGTRDASAVFKVDGEKLTGTISSEQGEIAFAGTTNGKTFNVTMEVNTPNGLFSIAIAGEVDGDSMKGTLDFGQGTGDFTGKRRD